MWILKNKAQIIIISTFTVLMAGTIVFILLLPILSNVKGLRETTDSYQALANSEAGLEIEFYRQIKSIEGEDVSGIITCSSDFHGAPGVGGSSGGQQRGHETGKAEDCKHGKKVKFDLEVSTTTDGTNEYLKINSRGKYNKFERTLFTGFKINI